VNGFFHDRFVRARNACTSARYRRRKSPATQAR
jgi:hypothetical protein